MKTIFLAGLCIAALGAWADDSPRPSGAESGAFFVVQSTGGGGGSFGSGEVVPPPAPSPPPAGSASATPEDDPIAARKALLEALQVHEQHGRFANRLVRLTGGSRRGAGNVVIRSAETDPKSIANAEEDLSVMSRILEKAMEPKDTGDERRVMGVVIPGDGSARNLQIQGYGAIFMLQVNFPLSGPPAKPAEDKAEEPSNSAWEEAKREVYGSPGPEMPDGARKADYDPKWVEELKESLLAALKNASNIRGLKESESVTVVVTSEADRGMGFPRPPVREFRSSSGSASASTVVISTSEDDSKPEQQAASTLTITARKSDIDAFAKGKLTQEEFRKRATVTLY